LPLVFAAPLAAHRIGGMRAPLAAVSMEQVGFQDPNQVRSEAETAKASGEFCYGLPGSIAPFENFDPLNLLADKS